MALTQKQARYARLVASGLDKHTAAMDAGCKNHESARKFVADMAKRENVQQFIEGLKIANQQTADTPDTALTQKTKTVYQHETPLEFLTAVFNDTTGLYAPKERISAAIALLPYTEQKMAAVGKKEDAQDTANRATASGKYATMSNQDLFSGTVQ